MKAKTELERFVEEPEYKDFELITFADITPEFVTVNDYGTTGTPPNNVLRGSIEGYGVFDGGR